MEKSPLSPHICIIQACTTPQCKTLGGSVSRFKLQKHESSFKHALFTAFIGCGVAQSSVCTACFPKMLKNQQRFHWHATTWHRHNPSCCYGYSFHLHALTTLSCNLTLQKLPNYLSGTGIISTSCLYSCSFISCPLEPRQPWRTFSRQYVNFKSKEL